MDKQQQPQVPIKMAATWSDTVSHAPGKPATRGFGGRLYFYDDRMNSIKVDGKLVVYIFDDDLRGGGEPQRKYLFNAEDFARHCTGSELGPSYSVWLPWDAVGGPMKQLSIVPFFLPSQGELITGEQTRHRLLGPRGSESGTVPNLGPPALSSSSPTRSSRQYPARQVAYDEALPPPASRTKTETDRGRLRMQATTIDIPPVTRDRLLQAAPPARFDRRRTALQTAAAAQDASPSVQNALPNRRATGVVVAPPRTTFHPVNSQFNRLPLGPWERAAQRQRESAAGWASNQDRRATAEASDRLPVEYPRVVP